MHTLSDLESGQLRGTTRLSLACGLTRLPDAVYDLADSLEILDLTGNALSDLPNELTRLRKLRVLFLSNNRFEHLPPVLGQMPELEMIGFKSNQIRDVPGAALPARLRWLILTDNQIETLPTEIGTRRRLQKLMLAGNRLSALPRSMSALDRLELLRISANRFADLPDWLFRLPRLAWLACAGNPWVDVDVQAEQTRSATGAVHWTTLQVLEQLGEGASGRIFRTTRTGPDGVTLPGAVKLFKGAVTSDGMPDSEMAACMAAGHHTNLIPVQARITGHPEGTPGLLLSLVDPSFQALAGPPSLASCTRDIYADDARFSLREVLHIATGMAAAAAHLHARGIMHGDLYAHNTLVDPSGHCLLGDFGAATIYPRADPIRAPGFERVEVRAFGCLLEELLDRCQTQPNQTTAALEALKRQCLADDPARRPLLAQIRASLDRLQA